MLTISKILVWPRDLESFKGGNFNTLSLVDCYVQISEDNMPVVKIDLRTSSNRDNHYVPGEDSTEC
jgi:hypothetical protein